MLRCAQKCQELLKLHVPYLETMLIQILNTFFNGGKLGHLKYDIQNVGQLFCTRIMTIPNLEAQKSGQAIYFHNIAVQRRI